MRRWLFLSLLCLAGPAFGGADTTDSGTDPAEPAPAPGSAKDAEYFRLSFEMHDLAKKGHWDGVERTYTAALATGHPLSFDEHMFGAQAALARGDVAQARARLVRAKALKDSDKQVIETLWNVDTSYAPVKLTAVPGSTLQIAKRPFDPQQAKAVGFATHQIETNGTFDGYLPAGHYTLEQTSFDVSVKEIGAPALKIDARTPKERRKADR